jgi:hypothetical protein
LIALLLKGQGIHTVLPVDVDVTTEEKYGAVLLGKVKLHIWILGVQKGELSFGTE